MGVLKQREIMLSEIIIRARPDSAMSSVKAYIRLLNKVMEHPTLIDDPDSEEWIQDYKWLDEFLAKNKLKDSTLRNYYVALMIYCEGVNGGKVKEDLWSGLEEWKHYKSKVDALNKAYKDAKEKNALSPTQEENVVSLEEIEKAHKKMALDVNKIYSGLNHSGHTPPADTTKFMLYVLLKLYLELPVRNELATLKFIGRREYSKLVKSGDEIKDNYLIVDKKDITIYRHNYKTSNSQTSGGVKENTISPDARKLVNRWLRWRGIVKGQDLFPDLMPKDGSEYSTAQLNLTKLLNRWSEKEFNKKISTTLLAKITTSSQVPPEIAQSLMQKSKTRGTNPNTLITSYINHSSSEEPDVA